MRASADGGRITPETLEVGAIQNANRYNHFGVLAAQPDHWYGRSVS